MVNGFSWTEEYRRTWDELQTESTKRTFAYKSSYNPNRKNIIRHLLVAIDTSESIEKTDYVPTIRSQLSRIVPSFSNVFTSTNPLSTLSFITCQNTLDKYSKEYNPKLFNSVGAGEFSMLNCLRICIDKLNQSVYTKECLIITASIGTKDSGIYSDIFDEIKKFRITINIISICGEVTLFKRITEISNGKFFIPIDVHFLESILHEMTFPLESIETKNTLVPLGIPNTMIEHAMCVCHLQFSLNLYECPKCKASVCHLPLKCPICDLHLVSYISIAQSYRLMYPLKPFLDCYEGFCKVCNKEGFSSCPDCSTIFCEICSKKIHDYLSFCIYCD